MFLKTLNFYLDPAALLVLDEQQIYLIGQIQTGRSAVESEWYFPYEIRLYSLVTVYCLFSWTCTGNNP